MCTVTVIPLGDGIRMACNRDESPLRPAALPPRVLTWGTRRGLAPLDPLSGGTWIGVNDAALVGTLLNIYDAPRIGVPPAQKRSRGIILPLLLACASLDKAMDLASGLDANDFADFRLVLADRRRIASVRCARHRLDVGAIESINGPMLFTSSGLGDAVVDPPRRALFGEMLRPPADLVSAQDAYHRHAWPDRLHLSVCMRRPEARTMSLTVIQTDAAQARMRYHAAPPDQPAAWTEDCFSSFS